MRELFASVLAVRESLRPMPRMLDAFATIVFGGALVAATVHIGDASFGWWIAWPLIGYAIWLFIVFALRNASGASDSANATIQDRMTAAALSGIAAGIVWSLHVASSLKIWLVFGIFLAAAILDLRAQARLFSESISKRG